MKFQLRQVLIFTTSIAFLLALVAKENFEIAAAFLAVLLAWLVVAKLIARLWARSGVALIAVVNQQSWQPMTQMFRLGHLAVFVVLLIIVIIALINHVALESVAMAGPASYWSWLVCPLEWIRGWLVSNALETQTGD